MHGQPERKGQDGQAIPARIAEAEVAPEAIAAEASLEVEVVLGVVVVGANGIRASSWAKATPVRAPQGE